MAFQNRPIDKRLRILFGKSQRKARENFKGENSKRFDLTLFRKETIKIVFDSLHGIDNEKARDATISIRPNLHTFIDILLTLYRYFCTYDIHSLNEVELSNALELLAYCLYDGKVDQKSEFETELYNELLSEVKQRLLCEFGFSIDEIIPVASDKYLPLKDATVNQQS